MKIGVVTYHFFPTINPRAFRAYELVKEMSRSGHDVQLFIPDNDYDYSELESAYKSLRVIKVKPGFFLNKTPLSFKQKVSSIDSNANEKVLLKETIVKKLKRKIIEWFYPGGFNFEFGFTCGKYLRKNKFKFDLIISIGLPICSHVAVWRAQRFGNRIAQLRIADYGDPYFYNKSINTPFFHKWFESCVLRRFDHIIVPTEKMVSLFENYKNKKYIHVIPQGLDFNQFEKAVVLDSERSGIVNMAFAGNFYKDIRDPRELFEYLSNSGQKFRLTIYTDLHRKENIDLINPFKEKLGERLMLHDLLPRIECVHELSKADFLVNISNTTQEQTPSKLIDYILTDRPIFSFRPNEFNAEEFEMFMNGNYQNDISKSLNKEAFDIKNVVEKIVSIRAAKQQPI